MRKNHKTKTLLVLTALSVLSLSCFLCGNAARGTTQAEENGQTEECLHEYAESVIAPTCGEKGYTEFQCTLCGDTYRDLYVPEKGHTFDEKETPPGCTEKGYKIGRAHV